MYIVFKNEHENEHESVTFSFLNKAEFDIIIDNNSNYKYSHAQVFDDSKSLLMEFIFNYDYRTWIINT